MIEEEIKEELKSMKLQEIALADELKNKYGDHVFEDDRFLALKFWTEFDGLRELLGHKYPVFIEWLVSVATPLSSIERSRRKLTEEKLIPKNPNRKNVAKEYAKYWGNNEQT